MMAFSILSFAHNIFIRRGLYNILVKKRVVLEQEYFHEHLCLLTLDSDNFQNYEYEFAYLPYSNTKKVTLLLFSYYSIWNSQ